MALLGRGTRDKPEDEGLDERTKKAIRLENDKKSYGGGRTAIEGRANRAQGSHGRGGKSIRARDRSLWK
jgi:hypothetical protein